MNKKGIDIIEYLKSLPEPKYLPFDSNFISDKYKDFDFVELAQVWYNFKENLKKYPLKYGWKLNEPVYDKCMLTYVKGFEKGYSKLLENLKRSDSFEINNEIILNRLENKIEALNLRSMYICDFVTMFFNDHLEDTSFSLGIEQIDQIEKVGIESGEYLKALELKREYYEPQNTKLSIVEPKLSEKSNFDIQLEYINDAFSVVEIQIKNFRESENVTTDQYEALVLYIDTVFDIITRFLEIIFEATNDSDSKLYQSILDLTSIKIDYYNETTKSLSLENALNRLAEKTNYLNTLSIKNELFDKINHKHNALFFSKLEYLKLYKKDLNSTNDTLKGNINLLDKSFDKLYNEAIKYEAIEYIKDPFKQSTQKSMLNNGFNHWLQNIELSKEYSYEKFIKYLDYDNTTKIEQQKQYEIKRFNNLPQYQKEEYLKSNPNFKVEPIDKNNAITEKAKLTNNNDETPVFNFQNELEQLNKQDNKLHKGLPMNFIIEHLKVFVNINKKNAKKYLTEEQFISFIKRGFLNDETQPKQKINYVNGQRGFIILRFYQLFDMSVSEYSYPSNKSKFIEMIIDCFDNLGTIDQVKSFFKPSKTKQIW
jgi:hypothetical protein